MKLEFDDMKSIEDDFKNRCKSFLNRNKDTMFSIEEELKIMMIEAIYLLIVHYEKTQNR